MLVPFGKAVWLAEGPVVTGAAGFRFPTRMAVVRLQGGQLLLWSPVAPSSELLAEVQNLGTVAHLVAPNALQHLFIAAWKTAVPGACVHGLPVLRERCPDLVLDAELTGEPHPDWAGDLDQVLLPNRITDEVVFFHRPSGTAIFTDLLQGMRPGWFTGWRGLVARLDRMTGTEPAVPLKFRLGFRDRGALRAGLRRIQAWPVQQVVMPHGTPVNSDASGLLSRAFAWAKP
jgi:Domain of unknown function (DUF4336)